MNALELRKPSTPPRAASDRDPEVPVKARRRRFTTKYKLGILEAIDKCAEPGEVGILLRREGPYLSKWRAQREAGALVGLSAKKRSRKPRPVDPEARWVAELKRENSRLRDQLEKTKTIIAVQKTSRGCWRAR